MAWKIEFLQSAAREMRKLDRATQKRILAFLKERVAARPDPRESGKPLRGTLAGLWRYRVGDWRLVCRIEDARVTVLVIRVAHRREVYD